MFSVLTLPNGDLVIRATPPGRMWLRARDRAGLTQVQLEGELFDLLGLRLVAPEWIAALTAAPIVTDRIRFDAATGQVAEIGEVWWFPSYAVESLTETLRETGSVVLTNADPARCRKGA